MSERERCPVDATLLTGGLGDRTETELTDGSPAGRCAATLRVFGRIRRGRSLGTYGRVSCRALDAFNP